MLDHDAEADLVVVGGGITGAFVADEAARRGFDVVVLEAGRAGGGSTAASTALLLYELDMGFAGVERAQSRQAAQQTYLELAAAVPEVRRLAESVGGGRFEARPCLYVASRAGDVAGLREEFGHRRELGFDVEWLAGPDLRTEYRADAPAAIRSQGEGQVDPVALTKGLLQMGGKRLRLFEDTRALTVEYVRGGVDVATAGGRVHARNVVFATGYSNALHPRTFAARPHSTYAIASAPVDAPWEDGAIFWETARPYLYGRWERDGRLLVGGLDDDVLDPAPRDAQAAAKGRALAHAVSERFGIPGLEPELAWAGTFAESADGLPFVGPDPRHPHAQFLLGYGANGTLFARVGAKLIADRLEGLVDSFTAFCPQRPSA